MPLSALNAQYVNIHSAMSECWNKTLIEKRRNNNNNNNGYVYLFREHIALSYKNGVDIELGKNNRLKALRMMKNHT